MENEETFTSWKDMQERLTKLSEEELKGFINYEASTYRRKSIIFRLHQRYSKLRARRERDSIVKGELLL